MTENATAANYISTYQIFSRKELEYLKVKFPERAEKLFAKSEDAAKERFEHLQKLVELYK